MGVVGGIFWVGGDAEVSEGEWVEWGWSRVIV